MKKSALQVTDICLAYGKKVIIEDVSFDIPCGQTFGLIGLNGVGKTTLIKAILGLRDAVRGTIMVEGESRANTESRKKLAFLPERFDPPWFLSGFEFLKFSMSLYDMKCEQDVAFTYAEKLALDPQALKNRVHTYSKGMRQKLGLMATLLTGCPLLILDEPMSGLDPKARYFVKEILLEMRQAGRTIFLSSHILSDMNDICDKIGVLNDRTLIFIGTPNELKQRGHHDNMEHAFLNVIRQ